MNNPNSIKYLSKDFSNFKETLKEHIKSYFPDSYNDFSEASPANMFIELAAYVGDVQSFYLDKQIQENFFDLAQDRGNIFNLAYFKGYFPKVSYASSTIIDFYQLVPYTYTTEMYYDYYSYNYDYCLTIPEYTKVTSNINNQNFIILDTVDFSKSAIISDVDSNFKLFKKSVKAISADIKTVTFPIGSAKKFQTLKIQDDKILKVLDIIDSDGNKWYEVPFLAQETVFEKDNNPGFNIINDTKYNLKPTKTTRRFTTRFKSDNTMDIQFGSGISSRGDVNLLPNPNSRSALYNPNIIDDFNEYNTFSFLFTKEYGLAPSNTTLTVRYLSGGGIESNLPIDTLTTFNKSNATFKGTNLNNTIKTQILSDLFCTNSIPSTGGKDGDSNEEIKLNAANSFTSQSRAVTKEDYISRCLSMPPEFGSVSKVYVESNELNRSLDLYILSYSNSKLIINSNITLKNNLKAYLEEYRLINDTVNIRDAFCINIGVNLDIVCLYGFNSREILVNCIDVVKNYFNIDKMEIGNPIYLSEIYGELLKVTGVQSVVKVEIVNKFGMGYSNYSYDIEAATKKGIIYPSLDPSIFEIKTPDEDINARSIN